ncbi:MAG: CPBP family intramembrane metalloprotease [Lachnospiraceae bacterium]|nr:CPBP family intramembrane metalloprotease [Lachnospiraceae bacterium]
MKKFFMALLKGLGYLGIYLAVMFVVQMIWGTVESVRITAEYAEKGMSLSDPAVMKQYMEDYMEAVMEFSVPSTIIVNVVTVAVTCLIFVCRKKKITGELSLRKFHPGAIVPLILLGLGMNVLTNFVMGFLPEELLNSYQESASVYDEVGLVVLLHTLISAPIVEEWVLRGLVFSRMKKGMPVIAAMLISSVLFGLLHGNLVWAAYATVLGMVLAWVFYRTKSLYASILLHFSYNLCGILLGLFMESAPDWLGVVLIAVAVVFTLVGIFWFIRIPKAEEPVEDAVAETVEAVTEVSETV